MTSSPTDRSRPRVCFLYIAQTHQIPHSLSIAVALARLWPQIQVEIAASTQDNLDHALSLLNALGGAPITARLMPPAWLRQVRWQGASTPPKALMLAANALALSRLDAIVTPERTTALLRTLGVRHPLLIYTQHGAGDRGGPFEPRLRRFDLVMAAGPKQRDRMIGEGWVKPENCAMVGYPKFDIIDALPGSPMPTFAQTRPIIVYNPHFHPTLGSWWQMGVRILEQIAASDRFNLIFAPHIRLFDGAGPAMLAALAPFRDHPGIHIDLGGPAAIDMTYTRGADVYLGDVSSQIYEFLRTPKPCLFLNPAHVAWEGDESFRHWRCGPVLDSAEGLIDALDAAQAGHGAYRDIQTAAFAESFDLTDTPSSERAASAIAQRVLVQAQPTA